jgi:Ni,Fe-hydrogenase III large subunit/Ni,Fe-hydrogenase III component G
MPVHHQTLDALDWAALAQRQHEQGARLLTLWGSDARTTHGGFSVFACWLGAEALTLAQLDLASGVTHYPGLHERFPVAGRLQRAMRDLLGLQALGMDSRPWLRHTAWSADGWPLRHDAPAAEPCRQPEAERYAFVAVDGEGVHEIAVGPVHAGVIEPGQFRFSVVGEKILRLEQRLGFTHKGVEKRFEQLGLREGVRLAARLSGDSAAANAWAYCMALEALADAQVPPRALHLRALLLERERLANHLGDLGAIGNDGGFGFALAQFSRLKEDLLRLNVRAFGARYPFDAIQPGGVAADLDADAADMLHNQTVVLQAEVERLKTIMDQHEGLQDRFKTTGRVKPDLAQAFGMLGLAARASGQALDLRMAPGFAPYAPLQVKIAVETGGDVAARVAVRFAEVFESLRLCRELLATLPEGAVRVELTDKVAPGLALGLVEGWRGPAFIALQAGPEGRIARCHPHDPSWQNWPALEWAVIGDIVPDFPLINKSFNLSYSGHDG